MAGRAGTDSDSRLGLVHRLVIEAALAHGRVWAKTVAASFRGVFACPLHAYDRGMAQTKIVRLIDDLDGTKASETVTFAVDGSTYEIDLSEKNAAACREALRRYMTAARKEGTQSQTGRNRVTIASTGHSR